MSNENDSNVFPGHSADASELKQEFEYNVKDESEKPQETEDTESLSEESKFKAGSYDSDKNICIINSEQKVTNGEGVTDEQEITKKEVINVGSIAEGQEVIEEEVENVSSIADGGEKTEEAEQKYGYENFKLLTNVEDFDPKKLLECLNELTEKELTDILGETKESNYEISQENDIYTFILNENESVKNTLESMEDDPSIIQESSTKLSYPEKCYFASMKLEQLGKEYELKKAGFDHELENLSFKLESLNTSIKDLKEDKEKFEKNIRFGGRHPVTKRIILQKVKKYFDDSIRTKMALTNRFMIQIQTDIMERNKFLSQIKAQEKRLASLDSTQFQETQFEHMKTCRMLAIYKSQLAKCKFKLSPLLQSWTEMKNALKKDEMEMEAMKIAVSKQEHLKEIILIEKARNDQKLQELEVTMRKIKLDPRRHDLPEVIDYAAAKRKNAALKKSIAKWQKKVAVVEQAKLLHISALQKENQW